MHPLEETLPAVDTDITSVSVIVPNFNYARYLDERIRSIFGQTYPIHEVVVLDDASTDNSVDQIDALHRGLEGAFRVVVNRQNSGSVFKQWQLGAEQVSGDFIWIAEADDLADPNQVATLVEMAVHDPDVVLAFCDSSSIDAIGCKLKGSYANYYTSVTGDMLESTGVYSGRDFALRFLSVKNIILNVSAVLWRRTALLNALEQSAHDLQRLHLCGDWRVYLECLLQPGAKVAYVAEPLNVHRRHGGSVTHKRPARDHLAEVAYIQRLIRSRFGLPAIVCEAQDQALADLARQFGFGQS